MKTTARINTKKVEFPLYPMNPQPKTVPCVLGFDSTVKTKKELNIDRHTLATFKQIIKEYGFPSPKWLTSGPKLTRPRRRWLIAILFEAGVGFESCYRAGTRDWSEDLHVLYHRLAI